MSILLITFLIIFFIDLELHKIDTLQGQSQKNLSNYLMLKVIRQGQCPILPL